MFMRKDCDMKKKAAEWRPWKKNVESEGIEPSSKQ